MATKQELEAMRSSMWSELVSFEESLSTLRTQQSNLASWVATLYRLLADVGAISRTASPFDTLVNAPRQECLFCGQVH
jgi:hypothetical protein